jgi:spore germination protein KA
MIKKIIRYLKFLRYLNEKEKTELINVKNIDDSCAIYKDIQINVSNLKDILGKSSDVVIREFDFDIEEHNVKACVCFIDGAGDKKMIDEYIIKPLMVNINIINDDKNLVKGTDTFFYIKNNILNSVDISELKTFNEAIEYVLSGDAILFIDGYDTVISVNVKDWSNRNVEQPESEINIRGSHEGFVELLNVNTSLLRRIIKNKNLIFESFNIGKQTHTKIYIAYIHGIVNPELIQEVKKRLNHIYIDSILESGYIEQLIEDNPLSPFATVGNSEKPDKVAGKLLEGRIAILCDGTPTVLTVPYLFIEAFQSAEDYYSRSFFSSIMRLLRMLAYLITLILPAFYIAVTTFHQEMIPTVLIITFASSREGVPFPILVEMLLSETIFMLLRESGIRMPRAVGSAVSIVGTLVIGQSAVEAGLIGAPMVIITSLTAITSFIIPSIYDAIIIFRFILIFLGGTFGLFGIFIGLICMLSHMCSLRSFGSPYMSPLAPQNSDGLKDSLIRAPLWLMNKRPESITWRDSVRQGESQIPKKPDVKKGGKSN